MRYSNPSPSLLPISPIGIKCQKLRDFNLSIFFLLILIHLLLFIAYSSIRTFLSFGEELEIKSLQFLSYFYRSIGTVGLKIGLLSRYGPFAIPLKRLSLQIRLIERMSHTWLVITDDSRLVWFIRPWTIVDLIVYVLKFYTLPTDTSLLTLRRYLH